jgi:CelD/BcsL family acetyltransferase involved in cellulose biosynthesis
VASPFIEPRESDFIRDVVHTVAPTGRLVFSAVIFNGMPIAFHLGFHDRDRFLWYLPTFDIAHIKHSPGEVLLKSLLEYAIDRNVREFDFGLGEEPYKYRFSNHARRLCALQAFRTPMLARAHKLVCDAKTLVKRSDTLARAGRIALQAVGLR